MKERYGRLAGSVLGSVLLATLGGAASAQTNGEAVAKQGAAEQLALDAGAAEARQKMAIAEAIVGQRESAAGRRFDARYRASLQARLAALPLDSLESLQGPAAEGGVLPVGGLTTNSLGDSGQDLVYTPVTPCRVLDTRHAVAGILAGGTQRNFVVTGNASLASQGGSVTGCGIPFGSATAVIINFAAVTPTGAGNLRAWAVADPQPAAPTAAVMNFSTLLPALANGVAVPICDPAATSCAAGDLRLQADVSSVHVVGDVVGYFSRPANRAYAMVAGTSFVAAATKNFVSVTRPSTGVYCLTPAAGISNAQPAVVTVEWGESSGFDLLAYNWGFGANGQSGTPCTAGQFHVRTYQFGANPASPTLSDSVAFQIFVP